MAWLTDWSKRVKLTIDQNDIDGVLANFPILVALGTSVGRNADDVSFVFDELTSDANRKKIAVTTSDGETQCYVEIEKWDDASEQAWLWVKVPSIASGSDTDLYLYYDSSKADNTTYVGDTNSTPAENVWDANFKLVSHMRDDPDTSNIRDSTANNNDMAKRAANEPIETASGKINSAQDFDGANDNIRHPSFLDTMPSALTLEALIYIQGGAGTARQFFSKHNVTNEDRFWFEVATTDQLNMVTEGGNLGNRNVFSPGTLSLNTWYYAVGMYESGQAIKVGLDAVFTSGPVSDAIGNGTAFDFIIGRNQIDTEEFNGIIDEVRVSDIIRTAAWITATNESITDDLLDFGSEEILSVGWVGGNVLGVDIATVSKINGVALADIAKVNGVA